MKCPNCSKEMNLLKLGGHQGTAVEIDVCWECQAFWFDQFESLQLSPLSTLQLMKGIGERPAVPLPPFRADLHCPRCAVRLLPTQDMQRNTRFSYFRCGNRHGRFIRFVEFLREKDFIRPLSQQQIAELRERIQMVNCSHCGAPIDLSLTSSCTHCGSPLSMLDMQRPQELLAQLQRAGQPKEIDPALPLALLRARRQVETAFGTTDETAWWLEASSAGLVQACLSSVAGWLIKSGI